MDATGCIPEIAEAIAAFVADPRPYHVGGEPNFDLRAHAAEQQVLPIILDMGGCYALRPSGTVVSFAWDEEDTLREEVEPLIRNMVYYHASLKFPVLASLIPQRSAGAVTCKCCGGSGRASGLPPDLAARVICYCGGLGWLPDQNA